MAAAHVAGVAALMLQKNSNLTNDQVEWILKRTATKFPYYTFSSTTAHPVSTWNNELGYGEIHALRAIQSIDTFNTFDKLCIKDFAYDNSTVPSNLSLSVNASPSIKVYNTNGSISLTSLVPGNTYDVKVTIHNFSSTSQYIYTSHVHVCCVPSAANMTWNSSFTGSSVLHNNIFLGQLKSIPAGGSITVTVPLTIPSNFLSGTALPCNLTFLAYLGPTSNIRDYGNSNAPLEGFVRWNSRVAINNGFTLNYYLPPIGPLSITSVNPNPTSGTFVVEYTPVDNRGNVQLLLNDLHGTTMLRAAATGTSCRLDASNLPSGQYSLLLVVDGVVNDTKTVIVR